MKITNNPPSRLLCFITAAFAVTPLCLKQAHSQDINGLPPPVKLITVRATIKNSSGKPLQGIALIARNQSGTVVEEPSYTVHVSGMTGQTYTKLPVASGFYFVAVQTHGYMPSPRQKISGLHDANLKFVLKRNPKDVFVRPVAIPNYVVMPNLGAPHVVQKASGAVQKSVIVCISPDNGFHRSIHLSVAPLPFGLSATFNPAVVSTPLGDVRSHASRDVRSQLVFRVAPTIRPGQYKVDLLSKPMGSHRTRHWPFSLTVLPAVHDTQFRIAQSETGLEIIPGGQARTVTLTLHPGAGFSGPVKLRLQNDPAAPLLDTPTLSQNTLDADHPVSTLTFRLGPHAAEGFHNLLINATAPTGTQTLLLPVNVLSHTYGAMPMPATERPGRPAPPLDEGPEEMTRHDMNETEDKPSRHHL